MTQYGLQITAAAVIAAVGFSTNSETVVIGSMLISPIGGLIIDLGKGDYASVESANSRNFDLNNGSAGSSNTTI